MTKKEIAKKLSELFVEFEDLQTDIANCDDNARKLFRLIEHLADEAENDANEEDEIES